jgi:hypothetical protein
MAAGSTYTPIATTTLGSAQSSYTFTSIPSTYTDLVLVANIKASTAANAYIRVGNGSIDSGTNYGYTNLSGDGSTATSARSSNNSLIAATTTGGSLDNRIGTVLISFQNYSNSSTFKTALVRFSSAGVETVATVGTWRSTSAINQIQILSLSPNYDIGSTFTLYGIAAA